MGNPARLQKIRMALLLAMIANASALAQPGHTDSSTSVAAEGEITTGGDDFAEVQVVQPPSVGGVNVIKINRSRINSKSYNVVFPAPPPTSKEEYQFSVSTGANGELSYSATCPTRGTSIGLGILLGSLTFANSNVDLPNACSEIQKTTADLIYLKQGRDAAESLGETHQIVLEKAIYHRSLRALAYTKTQIKGQLIRKQQLVLPRSFRRFAHSLTDVAQEKIEQQIEILQEDAKRLEAIISSTGQRSHNRLVAVQSAPPAEPDAQPISVEAISVLFTPPPVALSIDSREFPRFPASIDTVANLSIAPESEPDSEDISGTEETASLVDSILELLAESEDSLIFANLAAISPPPATTAEAIPEVSPTSTISVVESTSQEPPTLTANAAESAPDVLPTFSASAEEQPHLELPSLDAETFLPSPPVATAEASSDILPASAPTESPQTLVSHSTALPSATPQGGGDQEYSLAQDLDTWLAEDDALESVNLDSVSNTSVEPIENHVDTEDVDGASELAESAPLDPTPQSSEPDLEDASYPMSSASDLDIADEDLPSASEFSEGPVETENLSQVSLDDVAPMEIPSLETVPTEQFLPETAEIETEPEVSVSDVSSPVVTETMSQPVEEEMAVLAEHSPVDDGTGAEAESESLPDQIVSILDETL